MTGIRRGQLVLPFGVGAIVEVGQDSFVCAELSRWRPEETLPIDPSELQRITGRPIRTPHKSAPFVRFPRWMFCPACRRMHRLTPGREAEMLQKKFSAVRCPHCRKADLTPMGFVQACGNGHLDEIDWFRWAHRNAQPAERGQCAPGSAELRFITSGARGGDWETLWIECDTCGARNNLEGLTTRPLPWKCRGRQPWMSHDGVACDRPPGGHRRGDSNLYFPETLSAIDIVVEGAAPSTSLREFIRQQFLTGIWKDMRPMFEAFPPKTLIQLQKQQLSDLAAQRGVQLSEVEEAFTAEMEKRPDERPPQDLDVSADQEAILRREWPVLARGSDLVQESLIIETRRPGADWPVMLRRAVQRVNLIPRLREVRGLLGYRRVDPNDGARVPLHGQDERSWIPGVEVWGEGIFIQFAESYMQEWEDALAPTLEERLARMRERVEALHGGPARTTARFLALHTLSHALLRRLAFDAGYSSTALRERIYAGEKMAGILIYTADGDSEGSLGGLVRMGEPRRILQTIIAALNDASWCSADPVCGETPSQGVGGLNGAACHACSLVAETSCVHHNKLLDRHFMLSLADGRMEHGLLQLPPLEGP